MTYHALRIIVLCILMLAIFQKDQMGALVAICLAVLSLGKDLHV